MKLLNFTTHALAAVATSYVTLGAADPHEAAKLWAPYAMVTFTLSLTNLRSHHHGRRRCALTRLREKIETEIAAVEDAVLAATLAKILTNLGVEYAALAAGNKALILKFSSHVRILLAALIAIGLASGLLSVHLSQQGSDTASKAKILAQQNQALASAAKRAALDSAKSRVVTVGQRCELTELALEEARRPAVRAQLPHQPRRLPRPAREGQGRSQPTEAEAARQGMTTRLYIIDAPESEPNHAMMMDKPGAMWRWPRPGPRRPRGVGDHPPNRAGIWWTTYLAYDKDSGESTGRMWEVTGDPPNITVRPSINAGDGESPGNWHGFITDGVMDP